MATISAKELGNELGTDGRTVRKFLRSITPKDEQPGKGSRWAIERKAVRSLRTKFQAWNAAQVKEGDDDEVTTPDDEG